MKINVQKRYTLDGHRGGIYALEKMPESHGFYSSGSDGMVVSWDMRDPENGRLIAKMANSVYALHYHRSSGQLIVGQNFEGLHFLDVGTGKERGTLKTSKAAIFDIKSYNDRLLAASGDGVLYVVDIPSQGFVKKIKLSIRSVRTIALNTKRKEVALGLSDNTIRVLDLVDFKQKKVVDAHRLSVFSLAWDFKNGHLISTGRDAHIKSWDPESDYSPVQSVPAHIYAINSISVSPDGNYFATGSMDKTIKIWKTDDFRLLKVIDRSRHAGHISSVNKVLWTDYHNQLVSASDDRKISIWDLDFIS